VQAPDLAAEGKMGLQMHGNNETAILLGPLLKLEPREVSAVTGLPFLLGMSQPALRKLLATAEVRRLDAKEVLFSEGQAAEHFFCVVSGHLRAYRTDRDGRSADVMLFGPGDCFGHCMLFNGAKQQFDVQAAERVTIVAFSLDHIRKLIGEEPDVARAVIRSLSTNLLNATDCIANDRLQTAPQRVAHYILTHCRKDDAGKSATMRLPFQKSLLAGKLGLAPEALSRAFSTLKDNGVIVRGRLIHVENTGALENL
jgi:CRP/FNR family transcriptional regulator, dissimilatory nitrate respiration regulator